MELGGKALPLSGPMYRSCGCRGYQRARGRYPPRDGYGAVDVGHAGFQARYIYHHLQQRAEGSWMGSRATKYIPPPLQERRCKYANSFVGLLPRRALPQEGSSPGGLLPGRAPPREGSSPGGLLPRRALPREGSSPGGLLPRRALPQEGSSREGGPQSPPSVLLPSYL